MGKSPNLKVPLNTSTWFSYKGFEYVPVSLLILGVDLKPFLVGNQQLKQLHKNLLNFVFPTWGMPTYFSDEGKSILLKLLLLSFPKPFHSRRNFTVHVTSNLQER